MAARVESMGGTTLEIMMPSTCAISRLAGAKRLRSRMPHSSEVCSCTVRNRHWQMSLFPSKAPMVMLLLPASRASSTYASCKNQGIGSVVLAQDEEAVGIEPRGGAFDVAAGQGYGDPPPRGITGTLRKKPQDGFLIFRRHAVDGVQQLDQQRGTRQFGSAGGQAQRCGLFGQFGRKGAVVHIDSDSGDRPAVHKLH